MTDRLSTGRMAKTDIEYRSLNPPGEREWISRDLCAYVAAVFLSLMILSPMLTTGYVSDDALNSLFRGRVLESGESLLHHIYTMAKNTIHDRGRFVPLVSIYTSVIFILIPNLYLYKMSILFLIVINILLFRYLIQLVTGSKALSFLCILFLPLLIQFRFYHDPSLSFGGLEQTIFLYTLVSLVCFEFYLRTSRKILLLASLFCFMLNLMTYEMTYPFLIFYGLFAYCHAKDGSLSYVFKKTAPFLLVMLVFGGAWIFLKVIFTPVTEYEGIQTNFSTLLFIMTLLKQSYAATPLSYFAADPNKIFNFFGDMNHHFGINHLLIIAGYVGCFFAFSKEIPFESDAHSDVPATRHLLFLGSLLFVLPSILVALSSKYQREIVWGVGYLPVYISYFGFSIILAVMFYQGARFLSKKRKSLNILWGIMGILCGVIGSVNYTNNGTVTEHLNHSFLYPRAFIEEGLKNGLLKGVPQGTRLIVEGDYDLDVIQGGWNFYRWDRRPFYFMNSRVRLRTIDARENFPEKVLTSKFTIKSIESQRIQMDVAHEENLYYLAYYAQGSEEGYAVLGRVLNLFLKEGRLDRVTSKDNVFIYVQTPFSYELERISLVGNFIEGNIPAPFTHRMKDLTLIGSGKNWRLFKVDFEKAISLKSVRVVFHDDRM